MDNGKAGMLVPVGDANALAKAMHTILCDENSHEKFAEGIKRQSKKFEISTTMEKIEELIFSSIEEKRKR